MGIRWIGLAVLVMVVWAVRAPAKVVLLGSVSIAGTASDKSGLTDKLDDRNQTPHDQLGGIGSGIAWTGAGKSPSPASDRIC